MSFNKKNQKILRQRLRREIPRAEQILWHRLRRQQIKGYKFRRQHGIGPFVVDFYCPQLRLVIEIDGSSHFIDAFTRESDQDRQRYIEAQGVTVIRFTNAEIYFHLNNVLRKLNELTPHITPPLG